MRRGPIFALFCLLLMLGAESPALAQTKAVTFGDWSVGLQTGSTGLYAATVNDSGLLLGEYCYAETQTCAWLVASKRACEEGASYLTLSNTDAGASALELKCGARGPNGLYVYLFSSWSELEETIKKSQRLGLAVALTGDQFEVWRFSLKGMLEATAAMEKIFSDTAKSAAPQRTPSTSTVSETL